MNASTFDHASQGMRALDLEELPHVAGGPLVVPPVVIAIVATVTIYSAAFEFGKGLRDGYREQRPN